MKTVAAAPIRAICSLYSWRLPRTLIYMLQNTEYRVAPYLQWFWHTTHFEKIMYRRTLEPTRPARLLLAAMYAGIGVQLAAGILLLYLWHFHGLAGGLAFGVAALISWPVVWAHAIVAPLVVGRVCILAPRNAAAVHASRQIFGKFSGVKIAVAGSYGKTSMKELLHTVLAEGKTVAATPANKNVAISHAAFARSLKGNEEILVIEYGEGAPGDVARFAAVTQPTHAVITGLAPAHLDRYKTLQAAGEDIFSLAKAVPPANVFVNKESPSAQKFVRKTYHLYGQTGALGWNVQGVRVTVQGTSFTMKKGKEILQLHSGLVGRHQVGPLAFAAALARTLGLTRAEVEKGVAKTKPFEHRMQPYQLSGAWVVDDTYNGNIEGVRVGLELLQQLPAKRKIYITPGLVDQGAETAAVHQEMGRLIAAAKPDMVVLMQHSVTSFIQKGLEAGDFKGELLLESDPLNFYNNLSLFVATGDLVLMQNDWPDNYT